jgi:hypothetical protein
MDNTISKVLQELKSKLSDLNASVLQKTTFNVFDVLKISNYEIRHSNVLAWLFDVNATHGLSYRFLNNFVRKLKRESKISINQNILIDKSVLVYREFKNIDLLIQSKEHKWVIAIENKINHYETDNQIEKYTEVFYDYFYDYEKIFLYLTKRGVESSSPELWKSIRYDLIINLIDDLLLENSVVIDSDIINFLNHYQQILRRDIVKEDKTNKQLVEFYFKNKEILDKIIEVIPNNRRFYKESIIEILEELDYIIIDDSTEKLIRFTTDKIDEVIPKTSEGWTSTNRLLLFEFENHYDVLVLKTVIGPTQTNDKAQIVEHMKKSTDKSLFSDVEKKQFNKFAHVNKRLVFSKESVDYSDEESLNLLLREAILESVVNYVKDVETHFLSYKY